MKAALSRKQYLTPEILVFYFKPESKFDYLAGQYVEVKFPNEHPNSIGDNRWFTLSSSPTEDVLMITTRVIKPLSDFKEKLVNLKPGQEVILSEPIGDFVLPIDDSIPLVFISGGIGITPVRSIVKSLIDNDEKRKITVYYYVRKDQDLIFDDLFNKYPMTYKPIVKSDPGSTNWNNEILKDENPDTIYLVSGPQVMVENIVNNLTLKVGYGHVIMDYFPGYSSI